MPDPIRTPPVGRAAVSPCPYTRLREEAEKHLNLAIKEIDTNHYVRHIEIAKVWASLAAAEAEQKKASALGSVLPMVDRVTRKP